MPGVELVYGPMLIGVFFNCILFGVMFMQAFIYYQTYTRDNTWIRWFVAYLCLVETVNTGCDMYIVYQPLVEKFGTPYPVTFFPLFLPTAAALTVLVSTPVQIFMAWRIRIITQSRIIPIIIGLFSLLSFAGGLWVTENVARTRLFALKGGFKFNLPGVVWFVASAVADILITVTLVWSLRRRKTGMSKSTYMINRIIRLTVQTGLTTMVFALLDLFLFTLSEHTAVSFFFDFCVSKLYTNALLSTLNARVGWNNLNPGEEDTENVLFGTDATRLASERLPTRRFGNNSDLVVTGSNTFGGSSIVLAKRGVDSSVTVTKQVISDSLTAIDADNQHEYLEKPSRV